MTRTVQSSGACHQRTDLRAGGQRSVANAHMSLPDAVFPRHLWYRSDSSTVAQRAVTPLQFFSAATSEFSQEFWRPFPRNSFRKDLQECLVPERLQDAEAVVEQGASNE